MPIQQNNKHILILGATSDIASPLLLTIISKWKHCTFYLLARNTEKLHDIKKTIEEQNNYVELINYDLLNPPDVHFSRIEYCIILAGWLPKNENETNKTMLVNFSGIKIFIDKLIFDNINSLKQIIITGSIAGVRIRSKNKNYGMAKQALHHYALNLQNNKEYHFKTALVIPGYIKTKMIEGINTPKTLTISPENLAAKYFIWMDEKPSIVYSQPIWRGIALILKTIPEFIMKRLNF